MLNIKTYNILKALKNVPENEIAVVEEDKKVYIYSNDEWQEYKPEDGGLKVSLLELNQIAVTQLPKLTKKQLKEKGKIIRDYYEKDNPGKEYFMLLSNELHYYTVFKMHHNYQEADPVEVKKYEYPLLEDEVIGCLQDLGKIKSIAKNDDGVIECWITSGDTSYPLYFFDYEKGVIECH